MASLAAGARGTWHGSMRTLVVAVRARDRPGLFTRIARILHGLGCNLATSLGYRADEEARLLLVAECPLEPEELVAELRTRLREELGEEPEVDAGEIGPDAASIVAEFVREKPGLVTVLEAYLEPPDLFDALLRLPPEARRRVYPLLSPKTLAWILSEAEEEILEEMLHTLSLRQVARALQELDPDEAVDVLQRLPEALRKRLLQELPEEIRREAAKLLRYPPETVGGIMTTSVPVARAEDTVQDVLQLLRRGDYDVTDTVVVVDGEGRFVGLVTVEELLRAPPGEKLSRLARRPPIVIGPEEDREEAARLMLRYELRRLPVVDEQGRFLGLVTIEDVAQVLAEEAAEDIALLGGMEKPRERYRLASVADLVRTRLPWLLLIYVIESLTASVIKGYEDVIERIAVAAAFIPLIMDTGGNVGSQASSMVVRALALGEISERSRSDILYVVLKELATAATIGAIMALLGFIFSYIVGGNTRLAISIALTLFIVVIFADLVGASLPIIARRLGLDPAAISSPFVTTIVDVSVAVIYLSLVAKLVLGL